MKKSVIVGIVIFALIILVAIFIAMVLVGKDEAKQNNVIVSKIYTKYPNDVDSGAQYYMNSSEYEKTNKDEQVKIMGDLLSLYEQNGVIKNLYYDELGLMYTYTYNTGNIKGANGGVMLKEWDPMFN